MANTVRITATLDDKVSGGLAKIKDQFNVLGKSKGFQSVIQGVGVGAGINLYGTLDSVLSGVVGTLGDAVKGAMADEESQNRLRASLQANVPAWDGNTDAIEANITAKQRLGFDDETLRDSLTVLAGATHDVTKATEIQNVAMDLARFKGIDLRTASESLIKVEAGVYRSLKSLGIVLRDGATQEEALAAVRAVSAGQAEAYADTTAGKLTAAQVKINEEMERFGYIILPAVSDGLTVLNTVLDLVAGTADTKTTESLARMDNAYANWIRTNLAFIPGVEAAAAALDGSATSIDAAAAAAAAAAPKMTGYAENFGKASDDIITAATDSAVAVTTSTDSINTDYSDLVGYMKRYASDLVSDFFDPLEARAQLQTDHLATKAAEQALTLAKTKRDHKDAADDIIKSLDAEAQGLDKLAAKGDLTEKDVATFARDVNSSYRTLGQQVPAQLQHIIDKYREIARLKPTTVRMSVDDLGSNRRGYATGGYVSGREAVIVGERGPELFVPSVGGGTIIPNSAIQTMSGGGGGKGETRIIQLVVSGKVLAEIVDRENGFAMDRTVPGIAR